MFPDRFSLAVELPIPTAPPLLALLAVTVPAENVTVPVLLNTAAPLTAELYCIWQLLNVADPEPIQKAPPLAEALLLLALICEAVTIPVSE